MFGKNVLRITCIQTLPPSSLLSYDSIGSVKEVIKCKCHLVITLYNEL